jgi:hypothetical protein
MNGRMGGECEAYDAHCLARVAATGPSIHFAVGRERGRWTRGGAGAPGGLAPVGQDFLKTGCVVIATSHAPNTTEPGAEVRSTAVLDAQSDGPDVSWRRTGSWRAGDLETERSETS